MVERIFIGKMIETERKMMLFTEELKNYLLSDSRLSP